MAKSTFTDGLLPALERSRHLLPTCRHQLRLEPRGCVKFLIKITLPLSKHIKLNFTWLSSVFCSIIIIFIYLFLLSFHYHKCSALTTRCAYFWSVTIVFCAEIADIHVLFWTLDRWFYLTVCIKNCVRMFNIVLIVATCSKHYLKSFIFIATMQLNYSNCSYKLHYFVKA